MSGEMRVILELLHRDTTKVAGFKVRGVRKVLRAAHGPLSQDAIAVDAGMAPEAVGDALARMTSEGEVECGAEGWVLLTEAERRASLDRD